jgi:hypothetical protein
LNLCDTYKIFICLFIVLWEIVKLSCSISYNYMQLMEVGGEEGCTKDVMLGKVKFQESREHHLDVGLMHLDQEEGRESGGQGK